MRILILGGDGYLGWPTAMHFANRNYQVGVIDNYLKRKIVAETESFQLLETPKLPERTQLFYENFGKEISYYEGDLRNYEFIHKVINEFKPNTVVHFAEQPSAPYSMLGYNEASITLDNNIKSTFNLIWAIKELSPKTHIIKLGTMGEYGTPNIDIEEGWINISHNNREDKFLFPRSASSLYHTTKVLDTDLLWFYVRTYGLKVTDLMQGPVYGIFTDETQKDHRLVSQFYYDDIFGTVVNRFIVQAICGVPLTVYGKGKQTRGYINLKDTLQCIELAANSIPSDGELKIYNQITETLSVNQIAKKVKEAALEFNINVTVNSISNPRKEAEEHYYNPKYSGLRELGLKENFLTKNVIARMMDYVINNSSHIQKEIILPRVKW